MKIVTKAVKPRNPVAVPARQRHAGKHDSYRPERSQRRTARQEIVAYLAGKRDELN